MNCHRICPRRNQAHQGKGRYNDQLRTGTDKRQHVLRSEDGDIVCMVVKSTDRKDTEGVLLQPAGSVSLSEPEASLPYPIRDASQYDRYTYE